MITALVVAAGCAFVLAGALSEALDSGGDVVVWDSPSCWRQC